MRNTYQFTDNGTEIIEWIPSVYGKTLIDCLAIATERGLTWDADKLPESPEPRKQTKLTIMRRLDALGKWPTFKAVMSQMPEVVRDAWDLALEIDESDPLFVANREALIAALGITGEELDNLFAP